MLAHFGFYTILLSAILSGYGVVAALLAAKFQNRRLYRSTKLATTATTVLLLIASALLWYFLFQRDFSVEYVYKNSSTDLPWLYTFTAFWSSLEGSHMLWLLFMSICALVATWTYHEDNEHIMPYVMAVMNSVVCWMCYLAITHSDPFQVVLPMRPEGNGMNTLLQNPYMAIHPPLLFAGYTMLVVPFAYSLAALLYGDITEGWSRTNRRWILVAWVCLTAALTLGGRWAYVELGWAGYWAWDPVENSSFMPWIIATAMLHSILVQEKLGHLKRLTLLLSIAAFFMTFMGTFITRSGVISSVHSFAESPIGPSYLIFLAGLLGISLAIYGWKSQSILPPEADKVWGISKESSLLITQFLLLSFAVIVFLGTIFPIISEAITDQKISIQAPYFNAFSPWVGLAIMLAIGVGCLLHFQSSKVDYAKKISIRAIFIALPLCALLVHFGDILRTPEAYPFAAQIVGTYVACWTISCLTLDFYFKKKLSRLSIFQFYRRNLAYSGAYFAHLGMVVAIIGFIGNYRGLEKEVSLKAGEKTELYGYEFQFGEQVRIEQHDNAQAYVAPLKLTKDGKDMGEMAPAQRKYPTSTEIVNEIAVRSSAWYDIYILLAGLDRSDGKRVTLRININPTVRFVWLGVFLMCLGGIICAFDLRRGMRARDVIAGGWQMPTDISKENK